MTSLANTAIADTPGASPDPAQPVTEVQRDPRSPVPALTGAIAIGGPVDKGIPVPLYFQIAENLRKAIEGGGLGPGERIPNELELCTQLGVSRPTVRQAIQRLVIEGLLARHRGIGTIVVNRPIQRSLALTSLYDDLRATGRRPSTQVLSVAQAAIDEEIAGALSLQKGDPAWEINRLRCADDQPLAVMRNIVPAHLLSGPDLSSELTGRGLYELLRERGVQFRSARQSISARRATAAEARLLQCQRNSTVLTMRRVALDPSGTPVEYGQHAYLAERYSFQMDLAIQ